MWKKGLIAGFSILVTAMTFNWLSEAVIPGLAKEYQNISIFRPWNDPIMMLYFVYPFILGFVLQKFWELIQNKLSGKGIQKVFEFTKLYFVIATIPGMFISYSSFQVSLAMILSWTVGGFIQTFAAGYIFATIK
jgi:hypothetical protein